MTQGREFDLLKFRVLRRDAVEKAHGEGQSRTHEADPANVTWTGRSFLKPGIWTSCRSSSTSCEGT